MTDFLAGPLVEHLRSGYVPLVLAAPLLIAFLYCAIPHFTTRAGLRKYKGPAAAGFTRWWIASQVRKGHRSEVVHEQHKKYGKFVRIAPNEVSINGELQSSRGSQRRGAR